MNAKERNEIEKYVIKAIEEYLNNHEYKLKRTNISYLTSAYVLLDKYKGELTAKVIKKQNITFSNNKVVISEEEAIRFVVNIIKAMPRKRGELLTHNFIIEYLENIIRGGKSE